MPVKKSNGKLYWRSIGIDALAETDLSGNTTAEFIYFAGWRVAMRDGAGNVYYIFADHLASTRVVTDSSGTVCRDLDYFPFGGEKITLNTCTLYNYKFATYERDPESGLDYAIFRYHNSRLGRFMSPDLLAGGVDDPQSLNRYAYVLNDPINLVDPLGLSHCPSDWSQQHPCRPPNPNREGDPNRGTFGNGPGGGIQFCDVSPGHDGSQLTICGFGYRAPYWAFIEQFLPTKPSVKCQVVVPQAPPGVSVNANIATAGGVVAGLDSMKGSPAGDLLRIGAKIVWFYFTVRNRGPWDYKQDKSGNYQEFGNFNFGATGTALGLPREVLLRGAGVAQKAAGTSKPEWGSPLGDAPYGDDPKDQGLITRGVIYATQPCQ